MAEFKISRLRYTWKGNWTTAVAYNRDDVARYGGSSWVCVRQHTASAFQTDQDYLANPSDTDPTPAWIKMTDGVSWRGAWLGSTLYNPGDIALYGGVLYLVVNSHTSGSTFEENSAKWAVYASADNWTYNWTAGTRYGIGDVAKYNGIVYRCITEHTADSVDNGLEVDQAKWEIVHSGIQYVGTWTDDGTRYRPNDLVKYGGSILRCITGHLTAASIWTPYFVNEFPGLNFYNEWSDSIYYAVGDVVRHGGYVYVANENNNNISPARSIYPANAADRSWSVLSKASRLRGTWSATESYLSGDLVKRGGYLYVALNDTDDAEDGSSLGYLDDSNWEIIIPGTSWKNSWTVAQEYAVGDVVLYTGTAWKCNYQHVASIANFPGDNGEGFNYWDLLSEAGSNVALSTLGDLLTYGLSRALVGDGSTIGTTALAVGTVRQLLAVDSTSNVEYKTYGVVNKFVYVNKDGGVDDRTALRGLDPQLPYKTLRYALDRLTEVEDPTLTTVYVGTGVYDEVGPLRIPELVCVLGTELRSTVIRARGPVTALASDLTNHIIALSRLGGVITSVMNQNPITKSASNTATQNTSVTLRGASYTPPVYDEDTGEEIFLIPEVASTAPTVLLSLLTDLEAYLNYYIAGTGLEPSISSTNTILNHTVGENWAWYNSRLILEANRDFLVAEVLAYMADNGYTHDPVYLSDMINRYIDGFKKDLTYTGNYHTIWEARYYKNLVLGSQSDDMFYCRNGTGVRNCTLRGLTGSLNPVLVAEIYRRPTGGAYCSLDPGWGPSDETAWITSRSPYIQNVTTFGENCIGQKIDGALHLGGNKSMVSNDFTQVISDGIGAWVLNNGRAELVSVFTYYAQIGMFSEKGGVIRATNGNSSYGDFGAVADGNDPTETPAYAEVNNRTEQATISSAFAGEVNDEILALEFGHAGQNYKSATFTFTGAGTNATAVLEDTRDGAVFEALVKNAPGDAGGTEGAGGYSNIGNNAQFGDPTSLTLATNSDFTEANILGLRLIITSGKGAGQYGYITSYNNVSKKCNVSKESNGQPGWDHVIPGFPSQPTLFTDNTYRIEPRPVFSDPGFAATAINLGSSSPWTNVAYAESERVFSGVGGTGGGDNVNDDATFDVTKIGRTYSVVLVTPGAGYTVGETITIAGDTLGGATPENDCYVEVRSVSADSTDTLVGFRVTGIAASGNFVITPSSGTDSSYSPDGETWVSNSLPLSGNWSALAGGGNRFVTLNYNSSSALYSKDGITWVPTVLPIGSTWTSVTHGKPIVGNGNGYGVFLAVSETADRAVYSVDGGETWDETTLPDIGDSSFNKWKSVAYGKGKFIAVADTGNFAAVGEYNQLNDTWTWDSNIMDVSDDSSTREWISIAYGINRWIAISTTGDISYSYNGVTWYPGTMPTQDGSTAHYWKKIAYGQGLFFAVGDTGQRAIAGDIPGDTTTTFAATSEDGVVWTSRTLSSSEKWISIGFGNPDITLGDSTTQSNSTGTWIAVPYSTSDGTKILTGCRTKGRIIVDTGNISELRIWEPGSGYEQSGPTLTIIDPVNTSDAYVEIRTGDAVLSQPGWVNRGSGYRTSSTQVTILGDGFADVIPSGQFVTISGILGPVPGPGTQLRFRGATEFYTTQQDTLLSEQYDGTKTVRFRITPQLTLDDFLEHTSQVEIRERYSQVRITGHDFLDVGTGNFTQTNYPVLYTAATFTAAPENEVLESNGGRVFYTSTDQSGNFRCGELFAVEQATGIVTISADFFDFGGLTELALGGVRLGGSGAVVREFSTDPLFTQDSNNVVPTQRAIKSYLQNRLNVGGSDLLTASFIAGTVKVGPGEINNVAGLEVLFLKRADFSGAGAEISGSMMAQTMFMRSFTAQ